MTNEKSWGGSGSLWGSRTCLAWEPATDIYQTSEGWVVKFDLAGVEPTELTVAVEGCTLYVSGTRRDKTLREGVLHYQMEITYSRFERTIVLPCDIARASMLTEYEHGLLTITFLLGQGTTEERANE
jgi:HSP20 family protein